MTEENLHSPKQCDHCATEGLPLTRLEEPGHPYLCRRCFESEYGSAWVSSQADAMEISELEGIGSKEAEAEMDKQARQDDEEDAKAGDDQAAAIAKVEEVFSSFGQAMQAVMREQESMREIQMQQLAERATIVALVERLTGQFDELTGNQNAAGKAILAERGLLKAMDDRISLLMKMFDWHHNLLIAHGWASPRPEGGSLAN